MKTLTLVSFLLILAGTLLTYQPADAKHRRHGKHHDRYSKQSCHPATPRTRCAPNRRACVAPVPACQARPRYRHHRRPVVVHRAPLHRLHHPRMFR